MSDEDWAFFDENLPKDPLAFQYMKTDYPVNALIDMDDVPGVKQACRQKMCDDGVTMETKALEWDTRLQQAYNRDQMTEAGCDEDMVAAANDELEDSEEFEMFYDWLIRQCKEVTTSNAKTDPFFMRYVQLKTRDDKIVGKECFVNHTSGMWTHNVVEESKGSFSRQKSRICDHTVT